MPKYAMDYSKTILYKIICKDISITDVYIGHTTDFKSRKCYHKNTSSNIKLKQSNLKVYQFIRDNGGWDNWDMIKIEDFPCVSLLDALKRERELIEELNSTLNMTIPLRTDKEYYQDNKEKILKYQKDNKELRAKYKKKYRDANREKTNEKIYCECKGCYTISNFSRHCNSKKHQNYLKVSIPKENTG